MVANVRQILAPTDHSEPLGGIWRTLWRTKNDIWLFCIKKAANTDLSNASARLSSLENGAKETRTPDPLHAMQVLYQLSYGPMNVGDALGLVPPSYPSLHRGGDHT